jgi:CPA2 family monovalent cation:H+ antiporter-2
VGSRIARALKERGIPLVVAEQNRELVERLRQDGLPSVSGDASVPAVLIQAHIARAWMLVIASPDAFRSRRMIEIARTLNPGVEAVVRTHSDDEAALIQKERGARVFLGEEELATSMSRYVLERVEETRVEPRSLP